MHLLAYLLVWWCSMQFFDDDTKSALYCMVIKFRFKFSFQLCLPFLLLCACTELVLSPFLVLGHPHYISSFLVASFMSWMLPKLCGPDNYHHTDEFTSHFFLWIVLSTFNLIGQWKTLFPSTTQSCHSYFFGLMLLVLCCQNLFRLHLSCLWNFTSLMF